jgi:hypothetical protein
MMTAMTSIERALMGGFRACGIAFDRRLRLDGGRSGDQQMRNLGIVVLGALLASCAIQRAEIAQDARSQMVGMSKEQVLACMGAPANKAAEGATEVWGYASGNGTTVATASYDRRRDSCLF